MAGKTHTPPRHGDTEKASIAPERERCCEDRKYYVMFALQNEGWNQPDVAFLQLPVELTSMAESHRLSRSRLYNILPLPINNQNVI